MHSFVQYWIFFLTRFMPFCAWAKDTYQISFLLCWSIWWQTRCCCSGETRRTSATTTPCSITTTTLCGLQHNHNLVLARETTTGCEDDDNHNLRFGRGAGCILAGRDGWQASENCKETWKCLRLERNGLVVVVGTTDMISIQPRMLERNLKISAPYRQVVIAGLGGYRTGREAPNGQWRCSGRWALALLPVSPAT